MRIFITGTDTEVGKSVVTTVLASGYAALGSVIAAKPVASGVDVGSCGEDAAMIARACGHEPLTHTTYRAPLSPQLAPKY